MHTIQSNYIFKLLNTCKLEESIKAMGILMENWQHNDDHNTITVTVEREDEIPAAMKIGRSNQFIIDCSMDPNDPMVKRTNYHGVFLTPEYMSITGNGAHELIYYIKTYEPDLWRHWLRIVSRLDVQRAKPDETIDPEHWKNVYVDALNAWIDEYDAFSPSRSEFAHFGSGYIGIELPDKVLFLPMTVSKNIGVYVCKLQADADIEQIPVGDDVKHIGITSGMSYDEYLVKLNAVPKLEARKALRAARLGTFLRRDFNMFIIEDMDQLVEFTVEDIIDIWDKPAEAA